MWNNCPYLNTKIELTDERRKHIIDRHPDVASILDKLGDVLDSPDEIRTSQRDPETFARERRNCMGERISFYYDREADVLYFSKGNPYPEQESQEIGDDMVVRLNPKTREVEGITILNFSRRFASMDSLSIPITAQMKLTQA